MTNLVLIIKAEVVWFTNDSIHFCILISATLNVNNIIGDLLVEVHNIKKKDFKNHIVFFSLLEPETHKFPQISKFRMLLNFTKS